VTARDDIYFGGEKNKKGTRLFPGRDAERERPRPGEGIHRGGEMCARRSRRGSRRTDNLDKKQKTNSTPRVRYQT